MCNRQASTNFREDRSYRVVGTLQQVHGRPKRSLKKSIRVGFSGIAGARIVAHQQVRARIGLQQHAAVGGG
jgi:hypothetical protein